VQTAGHAGCNPEAVFLLLLPPSLVRVGALHNSLSCQGGGRTDGRLLAAFELGRCFARHGAAAGARLAAAEW